MAPLSQLATLAVLTTLTFAAPPLFESEKIQLSTADLRSLAPSEAAFFNVDLNGFGLASQRRCKVYPSDREWPADWKWFVLNKLVDNRLINPRPNAEKCYQGKSYDAAACAYMTANWQNNSYIHLNDPIEMMSPVYQGLSCMPPKIYDSKQCTMGGFPTHVVNATSPKHVQAAVLFARLTGVRLVVKNTGHDFSGKSGGANSLSIWTHYMKDINYIERYEDKVNGYSGPAFKCGSGVQAFEIYKAAHEKGRTVVGGEGETVGIMGGYIQGGGHSPLSSIYGTGADQVLAFEVVTPDGKFVTADSKQNTDLYWALRGGGGGTFGVVTSVTIKAHPDTQVTASRFTFTSEKIGNETFWAGFRSYFEYFIQNAEAGTYAYSVIIPNVTSGVFTFQMTPFFAPNKTLEETHTLLDPWLADLKSLGINFDPNITHYDSFYPAWRNSFPLEAVQKVNVATGSRLWPKANFETNEMRQKTFDAIRMSSDKNRVQVFFNIKAVDPTNPDNAVNPAFRKNILFNLQSVRWLPTSTPQQILDARKDFTQVDMQRYRDLSPGAGSYLGESDRMEPNFQQSFYGDKYERLLKIKKKYDPKDVFWVATGVGSEGWTVETENGLPSENGRLCRVK